MRGVLMTIAAASLALAGCNNGGGPFMDHHIAMSDVPAAPRAAIEREAMGGTVQKVERETRNGMVQYEADILVNGQKREVKVDENGKVLANHD